MLVRVTASPCFVIRSCDFSTIDTLCMRESASHCALLSAGALRQQRTQTCTDHEVSASNPHNIVQCRDIDTSMTATAADGDTLTLTFESTSGGYKVYQLGTSAPQTALFSGVTSRQSLDVVFDLEPPAHCSADSTCDYDDQPALEIYPDGTKVRKQTV